MGRNPPSPETIAKAWELHTEGRSVRYIAEALGCAPSTAAEYVKAGRAAEAHIDLLDRAEQRLRSATRLDMMAAWLADDFQQGKASAVQVVPHLVAVEARLAKLLGLDAPTRLSVTDDRAPEVDPAIVAAVRDTQSAAEQARRQLLAGRREDESA